MMRNSGGKENKVEVSSHLSALRATDSSLAASVDLSCRGRSGCLFMQTSLHYFPMRISKRGEYESGSRHLLYCRTVSCAVVLVLVLLSCCSRRASLSLAGRVAVVRYAVSDNSRALQELQELFAC